MPHYCGIALDNGLDLDPWLDLATISVSVLLALLG